VSLVGVAAKHRHAPDPAFRPAIDVRQLPLPRSVLYESWHRFRWPAVERATGPVDVTHATTSAIPATDAPLVATVHDLAFLEHPEWFTPRGLRLFRVGLRLARTRARLVLCPSGTTADACRRAGFDERVLRIVPWGVDLGVAGSEEVERVRRAYRLEGPYILSVGTHEPRKNIAALERAFSELGRDDLTLALVGPEGWHQEERPSSGDGVRRLGFVPSDDLQGLYRGAAAFCYPSLLEGFGLPVLEAMAQGTPVVTSALGATAELAGSAALTVEPSPGPIAVALRRLLDDPGLAAELREAGPERARDYAWSRCAELHEAAYVEAAA
jgi:glycosyltransferase involved in cell wall biosynthesis